MITLLEDPIPATGIIDAARTGINNIAPLTAKTVAVFNVAVFNVAVFNVAVFNVAVFNVAVVMLTLLKICQTQRE